MCVLRKDVVAVVAVVAVDAVDGVVGVVADAADAAADAGGGGGGEASTTEGSLGGAIEGGVAEPIEEMFNGVAGGGLMLMAKGGK